MNAEHVLPSRQREPRLRFLAPLLFLLSASCLGSGFAALGPATASAAPVTTAPAAFEDVVDAGRTTRSEHRVSRAAWRFAKRIARRSGAWFGRIPVAGAAAWCRIAPPAWRGPPVLLI